MLADFEGLCYTELRYADCIDIDGWQLLKYLSQMLSSLHMMLYGGLRNSLAFRQ